MSIQSSQGVKDGMMRLDLEAETGHAVEVVVNDRGVAVVTGRDEGVVSVTGAVGVATVKNVGVDAADHGHVAVGHVNANDDAVTTAQGAVARVTDTVGHPRHQMALAMHRALTVTGMCM